MQKLIVLILLLSTNLFSQDSVNRSFSYDDIISDCKINHHTIEKIKVNGAKVEDDLKKFGTKIIRSCDDSGKRKFKLNKQIRYVIIQNYSKNSIPNYLENIQNVTALELDSCLNLQPDSVFHKIKSSYISKDSVESLGNISAITFKNMAIEINKTDRIPKDVEALNFINISNMQDELDDLMLLLQTSNNIKHISIVGCKLDSLPIFPNEHIEAVSLNKNRLVNIPKMTHPEKLNYLDLSNNPFRSFIGLRVYKNLRILDISHTPMTSELLLNYLVDEDFVANYKKMDAFIFEDLKYPNCSLQKHCNSIKEIIKILLDKEKVKYCSYLYLNSQHFRLRKNCNECFDF